ncbi:MAG: type IV toxin-antitoxin system AbiEi family antitoxin domain-containing protein [Coriobacteriia bacterium]|nr:type IV toxin-antitoxin system AbiEi family antitoxin domain-containing protein [Coriobacteriia bacterium]
MSKVYHFWYTFDMAYYDDIYEHAADNYGLITSAQAKDMGIPNIELVKLAHRGRLIRVGQGIYKLARHIPVPHDPYAEAVALVGADAYLFGESVIAMHRLAPTNPARIKVATPRRVRKNLPSSIWVIYRKEKDSPTQYEGIPSQSIADAIRAARKTMMPDRLEDAARNARREGLIAKAEEVSLLKELNE